MRSGMHAVAPCRRVYGGRARVTGFSMVELLVAVLVMGVGVLGVTGLQVVSLQNNRDALVRSEALLLAYDILDRMRVNPAGNYAGVNFDDAPVSAGNCYSSNCSPTQMSRFDLTVWQCALGDHNAADVCIALRDDVILPAATSQPGLPDGQGQIEVNGAGMVTVRVRWTGFNGVQEVLSVESQS